MCARFSRRAFCACQAWKAGSFVRAASCSAVVSIIRWRTTSGVSRPLANSTTISGRRRPGRESWRGESRWLSARVNGCCSKAAVELAAGYGNSRKVRRTVLIKTAGKAAQGLGTPGEGRRPLCAAAHMAAAKCTTGTGPSAFPYSYTPCLPHSVSFEHFAVPSIMQGLLQEFAGGRVADLRVTLDYAAQLWHQRWLVEPDNTQLTALLSTLGLAVAINVLLMLLVPRGRKLVLDTVETVLAIALLAVLIAAVLGLPLGECFLSGGSGSGGSSVWATPTVQHCVALVSWFLLPPLCPHPTLLLVLTPTVPSGQVWVCLQATALRLPLRRRLKLTSQHSNPSPPPPPLLQ